MRRLMAVLALSLLLAACSSARAGPQIRGMAADLVDGGSVVVIGKGFGTHDLRTEWLGGAGGAIETASAGDFFSRPGWAVVPFPDKFRPVISSEKAYSGRQAILFDSTAHNDGRIGIAYDPGGPIGFGYASWLAYIDTGGAEGQWKMFRMNWECNVVDTGPEMAVFNWFGQVDQVLLRRSVADRDRHYPKGYPESGEWVRMEILLRPSTRPGKADGAIELWAHRPGKEIRRLLAEKSVVTYADGETRRWRYFVFQNYQGNGLGGHSRVWMDDVYVQQTPARVEIGNAPTWESCSHREIQEPLAWSPEKITFRLNRGRLGPGEEMYLYIVDAEGKVNRRGYRLAGRS